MVATGSTLVTFPVIRVPVPSASTVTLATWPSLIFATSASPTVPWSAMAPVAAITMKPAVLELPTISPTCPFIADTAPAVGAVRVAFARLFSALSSCSCADVTEAEAETTSAGFGVAETFASRIEIRVVLAAAVVERALRGADRLHRTGRLPVDRIDHRREARRGGR